MLADKEKYLPTLEFVFQAKAIPGGNNSSVFFFTRVKNHTLFKTRMAKLDYPTKSTHYLRPEWLKNHTPRCCTNLHSP